MNASGYYRESVAYHKSLHALTRCWVIFHDQRCNIICMYLCKSPHLYIPNFIHARFLKFLSLDSYPRFSTLATQLTVGSINAKWRHNPLLANMKQLCILGTPSWPKPRGVSRRVVKQVSNHPVLAGPNQTKKQKIASIILSYVRW